MEQHFRRNNQSNQSDTMIFRPWDSCPVTMDSSKSFPIQSSSSNLEERNLSKSLTSNQREIKTASPISLEKIQTNEVIDIVSTKSIQFQSKPLIRCPSLSNYSNLNPSSPKDLLDLFHVQFKNASLINPFVVPKDSSRNNYVMDEHSLFPRTPSLPLPFRANHYFDQSFLKNYPTNFPLPDRTIFDQMMIASSKTNQFLKNSMMLKMMNSVPQTSSGEQEFFEKQSLLQSNPTNSANTSSSIVSLSNGSNKKQRPKRFQCPHCQVSFSNNGQLKGHIRIHTGERPFVCDHQNCGKTFTRNEELTRHKRIHTGLRPFACSVCNKRFGRKDHLKKHIKTHQRPPPMPISLATTLAQYPPFPFAWI